jgi:deoxyribonuclease-4
MSRFESFAAMTSTCPPLGAHMSIAGGYYKAVEEARRCGCDTVQLFTKSNAQWRAKAITDEEARRFQAALKELKVAQPIAHASYLINLASPDDALLIKSIEGMAVELARAEQLGIPYVIVHPGAHTSATLEEGIARVAASIDVIHKLLPKAKAQIALEITAGQGSCLGCKLEQLAEIVKATQKPEKLRICVDTCHAFAAGYDLREAKGYQAFWRQFDDLLGLERLVAIHLNDSKRGLGSRIDRHEHIGRGQLGPAAFHRLLRDRRFRRVPMYIETAKGTENGESLDVINLRTLRELARA